MVNKPGKKPGRPPGRKPGRQPAKNKKTPKGQFPFFGPPASPGNWGGWKFSAL
jgi:hypothetical protein